MQAEYTYIAIFTLLGVFVLLTLWRIIRAAGNTIGQLRFESERDRYQHQRIEEEKKRFLVGLRRGSRRIDGKASRVHWDDGDKRAHRQYHVDDAADEVFDSTIEFRNMDLRSPWGWPSSAGKRLGPTARKPKPALLTRMKKATRDFFRSKQLVDAEVRLRQQRSIRAMVEDRYGRNYKHIGASEIEWSRPVLPNELVQERESERIMANRPAQDEEFHKNKIGSPRLVSVAMPASDEELRASGE